MAANQSVDSKPIALALMAASASDLFVQALKVNLMASSSPISFTLLKSLSWRALQSP